MLRSRLHVDLTSLRDPKPIICRVDESSNAGLNADWEKGKMRCKADGLWPCLLHDQIDESGGNEDTNAKRELKGDECR
jgi:hypothetical protein